MISVEQLNAYSAKAWITAEEHGFHVPGNEFNHYICLVIGELEAIVNADRTNKFCHAPADKEGTLFDPKTFNSKNPQFPKVFDLLVKDTFEDKLATAIIRLLSLLGIIGKPVIDMSAYAPAVISYKNKVTTKMVNIIRVLVETHDWNEQEKVSLAIYALLLWADDRAIDIQWHIERKMDYNLTRPVLHGKKY